VKAAEKALATARAAQPKVRLRACLRRGVCGCMTRCAALLSEQATSTSLQQSKMEKFQQLLVASDAAVNVVIQAAQVEVGAVIADASSRVVASRSLITSLCKRNEEESSPQDQATVDINAALHVVQVCARMCVCV
jgi:hypothetical protein